MYPKVYYACEMHVTVCIVNIDINKSVANTLHTVPYLPFSVSLCMYSLSYKCISKFTETGFIYRTAKQTQLDKILLAI